MADQDVMEVLQKGSPKGRMSEQDIIKQEVDKIGGDFVDVYSRLVSGVEKGTTRIMRKGNSLLIYNILQPGVAEVHISTADEPKALLAAVKEFDQALRKAGFKKAISTTTNPQIPKLLQQAGISATVSQKPSAGGTEYEIVMGVA